MARGPARCRRGPRRRDPGRHARGPRPPPADRHGPADHLRDLPPRRGGGGRRRRPAPGDPPRLRPAPHGLPRSDHDRLGHVHEVLHRRRHVAGPSRVPPDAVPERARFEPEPRRDGRPADDGRTSRGPGGRVVLPVVAGGDGRDRRGPGLRTRRPGPRLRAGDVPLPRDRSGCRRHVEGGRRAELPGDRTRLDGLVRRLAEVHAVVVVVQPHGRPRVGRRWRRRRRASRSWTPPSRSASSTCAR